MAQSSDKCGGRRRDSKRKQYCLPNCHDARTALREKEKCCDGPPSSKDKRHGRFNAAVARMVSRNARIRVLSSSLHSSSCPSPGFSTSQSKSSKLKGALNLNLASGLAI